MGGLTINNLIIPHNWTPGRLSPPRGHLLRWSSEG